MPNGNDKKLDFTLKVRDPKTGKFRPAYIAPDGTDLIQGDVFLSDAVNSSKNAVNGMTAATPAAVKAVQENTESKLSKTTNAPQTVNGAVTFKGNVTGLEGFIGDLTGTADRAKEADKLKVTGAIGSNVRPVYINSDGKPVACDYDVWTYIRIGEPEIDDMIDGVVENTRPIFRYVAAFDRLEIS